MSIIKYILPLLFVVLPAVAFAGTPAFVNRTDGGSVSAVSTVSASAMNVTAGNLLVVFTSNQHGSTPPTLSDTAVNTWHQASTTFARELNVNNLSIFYAYNVTGNASDVVTATLPSGTGAYFVIGVYQFSGFGSSDPYTDYQTSPLNPSSASSGSTATITASSNAVIVAGVEADNLGIAQGSGYTATVNSQTGYFADEYAVVAGSQAATFNFTNAPYSIVGASFDAPATPSTADIILTLLSGTVKLLSGKLIIL